MKMLQLVYFFEPRSLIGDEDDTETVILRNDATRTPKFLYCQRLLFSVEMTGPTTYKISRYARNDILNTPALEEKDDIFVVNINGVEIKINVLRKLPERLDFIFFYL
jgi:hypothetical protein